MSEFADKDQKTEEATPKRKEKLKEKGTIAYSRDLTAVSSLFLVVIVLFAYGAYFFSQVALFFNYFFSKIKFSNNAHLNIDVSSIIYFLGKTAVPLMMLAWLLCVVVSLLQVGLPVSFKKAMPNLEKLDPIKKISHLLNPVRSIKDMLKNVFKVLLLLLVAYISSRPYFSVFPQLSRFYSEDALSYSLSVLHHVFLCTLGAMLVWSGFDYFLSYRRVASELKMTRQEVKEEIKEEQVSPMIKNRIRAMQKAIAKRQMLQDVKKADVVLVNPTEYAVAIRYVAHKRMAPKVVAKGIDEMALKIRTTARDHQIPIIENRVLARTLYAQVKIGQEVPVELYKSVAQVLAYVYRIRGRRMA